jgi:AcrR family transcriptional regulator
MKITSAEAPASRFARRRTRTRADLLAAATRVLAAQGLHATTIADIAAAADVGVGTFYLHFPTKEALFHAVVDETIARLKAAVDAERLRAPDPVAQLRAATAAFFRFARDNREVFRIVFGHAAAYDEQIRDAQALFIADIEATCRAGIAAGAFADLPPALVAQATVGMTTQVVSWWTAHESTPIETVIDTVTTLALRGLLPPGRDTGERHG